MRNFILVLAIALASFNLALGQGINVENDEKDLAPLLAQGVEVVVTDDAFGVALKSAVEKHWKSTSFTFISAEDLDGFENKSEHFLLGQFYGSFQTGSDFIHNASFIGVTKSYKKTREYKVMFSKSDIFSAVAFDQTNFNGTVLEAKVILAVKAVDNLISNGGMKNWLSGVKSKVKELNTQTILVSEDDLALDEAKLRKRYGGSLNIVDADSFARAVMNEEDFVFLYANKEKSIKSPGIYIYALINNSGYVYNTTAGSAWRAKDGYQEQLFKTVD